MISVERILFLLVWLAAIVGTLPVLPFLPWWVQAALLLALLIGVAGRRQERYLLKAWPSTLLSVLFFVLFGLQVSRANLVDPVIQLLCMLLAVRLATEKSPRNILQLFMLATIILAASSLLTLDMAYLVYLVLIILLVTCGLLLLSFYHIDPSLCFRRCEWRQLLKIMILLPSASLVLMLLFFMLLPRTQTPLWNFLNPEAAAVIGMADQVRPGSVANLAESSRTAFRVEVNRLPNAALYWRGLVLNRLDGQIWKRSGKRVKEKTQPAPETEVVLNFFSEAKADRYLVTLDQPRQLQGLRHNLSADGVVSGRWRSGKKLRYQVHAQLAARNRQTGPTVDYLAFPDSLTPRVMAVGERIGKATSHADKIARLQKYFTDRQLEYSSRQLLQTDDPIDTFLFVDRRGYCEYFASSFAILLRVSGVPARLVGGYLGGDYNDLGGYYLVAENTAHVWVEALDDQGLWQRIDPSRLAVNADAVLLQVRNQGGISLRRIVDAMSHYWSRIVLNYDLHQQFGLLRQVATSVRDLKSPGRGSVTLLGWVVPLLLLGFGLRYLKQRKSREQRLIDAYLGQLLPAYKNSGSRSLGLFEIAKLTDDPLCQEFAEVYGRSVYRDQPLETDDYRRLRSIVRELAARQVSIEVAKPEAVGDNTASGN